MRISFRVAAIASVVCLAAAAFGQSGGAYLTENGSQDNALSHAAITVLDGEYSPNRAHFVTFTFRWR